MSYIPQSRADLATAIPYSFNAEDAPHADHTTKETEVLRCSADLNVILNQTPKDRETVMIKLTTANTVNITGYINITSSASFFNVNEFHGTVLPEHNSNPLSEYGGITVTMNTADTTRIFTYIREFGEWFPYN